MQLSEIDQRRNRIRLPLKELAPLVPLSCNAIGDALKGRSEPHPVTRQAIEHAVVGEELRLRDYLLALHPLATGVAP